MAAVWDRDVTGVSASHQTLNSAGQHHTLFWAGARGWRLGSCHAQLWDTGGGSAFYAIFCLSHMTREMWPAESASSMQE